MHTPIRTTRTTIAIPDNVPQDVVEQAERLLKAASEADARGGVRFHGYVVGDFSDGVMVGACGTERLQNLLRLAGLTELSRLTQEPEAPCACPVCKTKRAQ